MKAKALFFAMAVALAACNNGNPQDQKANEPESTAIQATNDNLPKKDIITDDGLGEFKIGTTIPDSHPDYDIKPVVSVDEEEMEEINFGVGLEYSYDNKFFLRAGYHYEHPNKGNRKYYTVGAGFKMNVFSIDAGYVISAAQTNPLDQTLRFTLAFDMDGISDLLVRRR
jgi:hypothetical protein